MKRPFLFVATALALTANASADPLSEVYWRNFYIHPHGRWNAQTIPEFRASIFSKVGGVEPDNVKIAFTEVLSFYMEHTQGAYYDYIFEPYHPPAFPDNRGWEVIRMMRVAEASDARVTASMNGMPWGDSGDQSIDNLSNFLEKYDDGIYGPGGLNQIDRQGRFRSAAQGTDPSVDEVRDFAPQLEMQLSLSPYCTTVADYTDRNLRQATRILQWYREQHPDLVLNLSGSSEVTLNVHANLDYNDYSVYTKAEFRDWLRGGGIYEGEAQFASLNDLNQQYNLSFASWEDVEPPTAENWSANSWWSKWHEFRIHQVQAIVQRQADITRQMGWCPDRIYGHQISGPIDPESGFDYRQQAAPLSTTFITGAAGGITAYLEDTRNELQNDAMYADDKNWGYFEFNPIQLISGGQLIPGTKEQGDEALRRLWEDKATQVSPYLWDGGLTGGLAPYTIKTRPFEESLQDFVAERQNQQVNARAKREVAFDARSPIWGFSKAEEIEGFSGISTPTFSTGKASFQTNSTDALVHLEFAESPTRYIQSDEYHAIEFRMTLSTALSASEGSVSWVDAGGNTHSVTFPARAGTHVYRINVGGYADWQEKQIADIRIAPINRSGVSVTLDWFLLRANPCWHFDADDEIYGTSNLDSPTVANGSFSGTDANDDGHFGLSTDNARGNSFGPEEDADRVLVDAGSFDRLRFKITSSTTGGSQLYFWKRGASFAPGFSLVGGMPIQPGTQTVERILSENADWNGEVTRLRLDPVNVQNADFTIDYVNITPRLLAPHAQNADLIVNSAAPAFLWDTPIEPNYTDITWEFELSRSADFQEVVVSHYNLDAPQYIHPEDSVFLDGHYYWRARACSGTVKSAWMAPMPIFVRSWQFNTMQDMIGAEFGVFTRPSDLINGSIIDGVYTAQLSDSNNNGAVDPYFYLNNGNTLSLGINTDAYKRFRARYRITGVPPGQFFYTPQIFFYSEDTGRFGSRNGQTNVTTGDWVEVDVDLSQSPDWQGYQKYIRFDPAFELTGGTLEIDWAYLVSDLTPTEPDSQSDTWLLL